MNVSIIRTIIPHNKKDLFLSNVSVRIAGIHGCLYLISEVGSKIPISNLSFEKKNRKKTTWWYKHFVFQLAIVT